MNFARVPKTLESDHVFAPSIDLSRTSNLVKYQSEIKMLRRKKYQLKSSTGIHIQKTHR